MPCNFSLFFNHPMSIDGERLGFLSQPLAGRSTYVAPHPTRVVKVGHARTVSNLLRVGEDTSQKRLHLHATGPPAMTGVIVGRGRLRTIVNGQPFAHGFQIDDLVRIARAEDSDAGRATIANLPAHCSCVVTDVDPDPCILHLDLPDLVGLDTGTCVTVTNDPEPSNFSFVKPNSLPKHMLGFGPSLLYGIDGSTEDEEARRLPPYVARGVHCLDHPDYVLITFSESSGTHFEHEYDGQSRQIFCKMSLYPLFREERALPRDTKLLRENLGRFTISFVNPDFSAYHFHNQEFSFSLSFI
jgi:hypothetical protein